MTAHEVIRDTRVGSVRNSPSKLLCLWKSSENSEVWKPHGTSGEGYFERGHYSALKHLCSEVNVATIELKLWLFRAPFGWIGHNAVPGLCTCVSESKLDLLPIGLFAMVDRELLFCWKWLPSLVIAPSDPL